MNNTEEVTVNPDIMDKITAKKNKVTTISQQLAKNKTPTKREIVAFVDAVAELTESQETLVKAVVKDLVKVANHLISLEMSTMNQGSSLMCISKALLDKQTISEGDLKTAWETHIKPLLQTQAAQEALTETPAEVVGDTECPPTT